MEIFHFFEKEYKTKTILTDGHCRHCFDGLITFEQNVTERFQSDIAIKVESTAGP